VSSDEDFFQWLPEYSVNVQTLDKQHRELVNILNRLFNAVSGEAGDNTITEFWTGLLSTPEHISRMRST